MKIPYYKVAVVIPIYREGTSTFEKISLNQAARKLSSYPFVFVTKKDVVINMHQNLVSNYGCVSHKEIFHEKYFSSIEGYNNLLISKQFYARLSKYDYLLILQLDAFVFKDDLQSWCHAGFGYVGAPWIEGYHTPGPNADYVGVGNGGLSLRKVDQFLTALSTFSYIERPASLLKKFRKNVDTGLFHAVASLIKKLTFSNNTFSVFNDYRQNEDDFWGRIVPGNFKWFIVPDAREALKFSMEVNPRKMFEDNGKKLPFGCHAWWRYDLDFWKPYIEAEGHFIGNTQNHFFTNESL